MRSPTTLPASSQSEPRAAGPRQAAAARRFEPVGPQHAEALAALFERNSTPAVTGMFDPFPLTVREAHRIALTPRKDLYYVASSEGRLLGLSMLRGFDEGYEIPSFGIFVDHESHRQGVGRELTAWTIEQARRLGCPAVRLTVYARNLAARRLYESLAFVEQKRQSSERAGRPEEKIVMLLDFGG
jgi:[ribosomal protein S18]-alanine N-acetyltransferase